MDEAQAFAQLKQHLRQWHGRRRLRDGLVWVPRGLLVGLMAAVVVATVARLRPLLDNNQVAVAATALGLAGLLVVLVVLLLRRHTLLQQARFADRHFHLQERASTAVEIQDGRLAVPAELAQQQLRDTLSASRQVDEKTNLPLRVERQTLLMILVTVALLVMAVLVPNPQSEVLKKRRAVARTIEEQVQALEALREEIAQNPELTEEQKEEIQQPLESALEELNQGDLSQEEAVATLSEAEAELRQLGDELSTDSLRQTLQDAGQSLADNPAGQSLGQSLQNGNLAQAGSAAAQLADELSGMSEEEQAALAQDLAETAAALQGTDSELAQQLDQAAQALQNGDTAAAQQALREVSGTLQQRAQESAAAQQAQDAAGQLNQGRQEVAQAGQSGQPGQPGQGQQGQGEGQGQGQGQGEGTGQGQGDGQGQGQGQGSGSEQGEGTGGPGPGGGHAENVYVPDVADLSDEEGVDIELPADCLANPANCGQLLNETPTEFTGEGSTVPYNQVFGDYRDAAHEALSDDYIPLGMKGYIRDYFSSLEPDGN